MVYRGTIPDSRDWGFVVRLSDFKFSIKNFSNEVKEMNFRLFGALFFLF